MQDKKLASDLPFKPQGLGGETGSRTALARSDTPLRNPRRPRAAILYPETHNVTTALGAQFRVVSGVGQPGVGGSGMCSCVPSGQNPKRATETAFTAVTGGKHAFKVS